MLAGDMDVGLIDLDLLRKRGSPCAPNDRTKHTTVRVRCAVVCGVWCAVGLERTMYRAMLALTMYVPNACLSWRSRAMLTHSAMLIQNR
jgi:hypothetical protein